MVGEMEVLISAFSFPIPIARPLRQPIPDMLLIEVSTCPGLAVDSAAVVAGFVAAVPFQL